MDDGFTQGGPDALPLVTESAHVTTVEAMDENRVDEVLDALSSLLDAHVGEKWISSAGDSRASRRRWLRNSLDEGVDLTRIFDLEPEPAAAVTTLSNRYQRPVPSLVRVRVDPGDPVYFVPGQYLSLRYDGVTRPYSVASSPEQDHVEFCIRRVPGGELTPTLTDFLEPGDEVAIRGPYGEFVVDGPSPHDLVFLATGTGVAPLKSMIDYVFETGIDVHAGEPRDVWLFLGCGWEDDLPYREAFRECDDARENFHFVPTLSREGLLTDWEGETAYVQRALAKYLDPDAVSAADIGDPYRAYLDEEPCTDVDARIDPGNTEVYACGIDAMVTELVAAVERFGVPGERVSYEGFG